MARVLTVVLVTIALVVVAWVLLLSETPQGEQVAGSPADGKQADDARSAEALDKERSASQRTVVADEVPATAGPTGPEPPSQAELAIELRHAEDQEPIRGGVISIDLSSLTAEARAALLPLNEWYYDLLTDSEGKAHLALPPGLTLLLRFAADIPDVEAVTGDVGPLLPGETPWCALRIGFLELTT